MGGIENYVNGPYYEWWDAVKRVSGGCEAAPLLRACCSALLPGDLF